MTRSVAGYYRKVFAERVERNALERRKPAARELQRTDRGQAEGPAENSARVVVEQRRVERRVVRDEHGAAREPLEVRQHALERRRVGDHRVRNAGQLGDVWRNRTAGVHQPIEALDRTEPAKTHGADLGYAGLADPLARRLHVDHDDVGVVERDL